LSLNGSYRTVIILPVNSTGQRSITISHRVGSFRRSKFCLTPVEPITGGPS